MALAADPRRADRISHYSHNYRKAQPQKALFSPPQQDEQDGQDEQKEKSGIGIPPQAPAQVLTKNEEDFLFVFC